MADGVAQGLVPSVVAVDGSPGRRRARLFPVSRRGPVLRPARGAAPEARVFGLDLTAGCGIGCGFCAIRGASRYPGDGRMPFDPATAERLIEALEGMARPPSRVVLSPSSDPLPPDRDVRAETLRVVRTLLERRIEVLLMTRGRIGKPLTALLLAHVDRAKVAVPLISMGRGIVRRLEGNAASPSVRLRGLRDLIRGGVDAEVRLEPLIAGLTDTRENLVPLFDGIARAGVRRVVAHYLFLHPSMESTLAESLGPLGWSERVLESFQGGPVFGVGSYGPTKHVPIESRKAGLARLIAWAAEFGLTLTTGQAQNPDLPRLEDLPRPILREATPRPIEPARPTRRRPAPAPVEAIAPPTSPAGALVAVGG